MMRKVWLLGARALRARQLRSFVCGLLLAAAGPAAAWAETPVDLELVIAADVSVSMDREEKRLQQEGFAEAFRHPDILAAINSGTHGRIAVTYIEWGGDRQQRIVVPWTLIDGPENAMHFSARLERSRPAKMVRGTSISSALVKAAVLMEANGFAGMRRIINLSGDGVNNKGPELADVRAVILGDGITINGLPIIYKGLLDGVIEGPNSAPPAGTLVGYFEQEVIGGPDSFVEPVKALGDYADAIRRKLQREIEAPAISAMKNPGVQARLESRGVDLAPRVTRQR
jgi:uncharacterized protein DUF1194